MKTTKSKKSRKVSAKANGGSRSLERVVRRCFVAQLYADADTVRVFEDDEFIADLALPGGLEGDKWAGREALKRCGFRQPKRWTPTEWGWEAHVTSIF